MLAVRSVSPNAKVLQWLGAFRLPFSLSIGRGVISYTLLCQSAFLTDQNITENFQDNFVGEKSVCSAIFGLSVLQSQPKLS